MTTAKAMEYMITRRVLERRGDPDTECPEKEGSRAWPERLIRVAAVTAALVVGGSFLQELLWAVLAVATACALALD